MTRIELDAEDFNSLLRCMTNLRDHCNDVDIRGGFVRQRSNDVTSVFEFDLTSIIGDISLPISDLKQKLDLLKIFAGQDVEIEVEEGEDESSSFFTISDEMSSIKFMFPTLQFMDNKFMTNQELESIFNLDDDDLFLSTEMTKVITDRIRVISENFNIKAIQVKFDEDKASVVCSTQSKDQFATFTKDIPITIEFEEKYLSNLGTVPFCIDHDTPLNFKMFKVSEQDISYNKFETELGSVEIKIYSRSSLVSDEE
jgi:hypothetical protein